MLRSSRARLSSGSKFLCTPNQMGLFLVLDKMPLPKSRSLLLRVPPPLTPPRKGEGNYMLIP
jgi:hypothetical protein